MEEVRRAAQNGQFEEGVHLFNTLVKTTPTDLRWFGVCLIHLKKWPQAEVSLHTALAQGEQAAAIHLASLHFMHGKRQQALTLLESVSPESMQADDAALWHRLRCRLGWVFGEEKKVLLHWGERAWEYVGKASTDTQVSVAITVGDLHCHVGEPQRALAYLDFALEQGNVSRQHYAQLCRANALMKLKRFDEAEMALASVTTANLETQRELKRAQCLAAQGKWQEAKQLVLNHLDSFSGQQVHELQVQFLLSTAALVEKRYTDARRFILRAEALASCPWERARLNYLKGFWEAIQGNEAGCLKLEQALQFYQSAGHDHEAVVVLLALAECQQNKRAEFLKTAAELALQQRQVPCTHGEWLLFPEVWENIQAISEDALECVFLGKRVERQEVTLLTFDTPRLMVAGKRIPLRMGLAELVLTYCLLKGAVTLDDLRRDLFPNSTKERAKNYFHQVRVELSSRVPGVSIQYDAARKIYELKSEHPIQCDVQFFIDALEQRDMPASPAAAGQFFSAVDLEWVKEERERLRRWVTEVGIETMDRFYQQGEYQQCISVAERLLPLDPLDIGLHQFLLTATFKAKGRLAANHCYRECAATFALEVGEIPPALQKLYHSWNTLN